MKLRYVAVKGLFYEYDYRIGFNDDMTFIHSPNGCGKSTIMSMINAVLNGDYAYLSKIPFVSMSLEFYDGAVVSVVKEDGSIEATVTKGGETKTLNPEIIKRIAPVVYLSSERLIIRKGKGHILDALDVYREELRTSDLHNLDIYIRVFKDIVNNIYNDKKVDVDENGEMHVRMGNGTELDIDKLSSGEKQILIISYVMTFHAGRCAIAIIDEPEISLHVSWQQKLGDIFLKISSVLNLQMIVTTHSPMVIHDKWDYAQELRHDDARIHHG